MSGSRSGALIASLSFVLLAATAAAQEEPCPTPRRYIFPAYLTATPTSYTMHWDPVPGGGVYEVLQSNAANYCAAGSDWAVIGRTAGTSFTASKPVANIVYRIVVRLASDHCVGTKFVYVTDTFTRAPAKPFIDSISLVNGNPKITTSYRDPLTLGTFVHRACGNEPFATPGFIYTCGSGVKSFSDNPATNFDRTPPLVEGTYQYRLMTRNDGTAQSLYSEPVTITIGALPRIRSFVATPSVIARTQAATLSWDTSSAESVTLNPGGQGVPESGSLRMTPQKTTTYTLTAKRGCGSVATQSTTVDVVGINSFKATPPIINSGEFTTLSWSTDGANTVTIDPRVNTQGRLSGSVRVTPSETTTYVLKATSANVTATARVVVVVWYLPDLQFEAAPAVIRQGESSTLFWRAEGATAVDIVPDVGFHLRAQCGGSSFCSHPVMPARTTTYVLTAHSAAGDAATSTTVQVVSTARVRVTRSAGPMLQPPGIPGASTSYVLTNSGGAPAAIRLAQSGNFFSHSPTSFTLAPGASQTVTVTAFATVSRLFEGFSIPTGDGVPAGLQVAIRLLTAPVPGGFAQARPVARRLNVNSPNGAVAFTNSGNATLTGVLSSDAPWLAPENALITIPAGGTVSAAILIDRSKRPDAIGTAAANLTLSYFAGSSPVRTTATVPEEAISSVTVLDTVLPQVGTATPPPLADGELALFVPGAGHVEGSVGLFLSDVLFSNPFHRMPLSDLRLYYTSAGSAPGTTKSVSFPLVDAPENIRIADAAKNLFGAENGVGVLQIRSKDTSRLGVCTTIFNANSPSGTYGTTIPTFRSDRAAGTGETIVLTGLRQNATSHTNLFIQETSGRGADVTTEFLAADGTLLATRSDRVGPFALAQINGAVPAGAVAAVLTNDASSAGAFHAYATPVDEASGDNWSVVDWARQYDYAADEPRIVPVAGAIHGANNTYFRTELAITNRGATGASGTLRFVSRSGEVLEHSVAIDARQSLVVDDVVGTLFGIAGDAIGYLVFTPTEGMFAMTSRTYTTVDGQPATFGTGVPALPRSAALTSGTMQSIGALEDSPWFRTNFGLVETSGKSAHVRVTLRFDGTSASKEYDLAPNQFLLLPGLAGEILGDARSSHGHVLGATLDVQVTGGDGSVMFFASTVDNGTGDSILRTE